MRDEVAHRLIQLLMEAESVEELVEMIEFGVKYRKVLVDRLGTLLTARSWGLNAKYVFTKESGELFC